MDTLEMFSRNFSAFFIRRKRRVHLNTQLFQTLSQYELRSTSVLSTNSHSWNFMHFCFQQVRNHRETFEKNTYIIWSSVHVSFSQITLSSVLWCKNEIRCTTQADFGWEMCWNKLIGNIGHQRCQFVKSNNLHNPETREFTSSKFLIGFCTPARRLKSKQSLLITSTQYIPPS